MKMSAVVLAVIVIAMFIAATHMFSFGTVCFGVIACLLFGALVYALVRSPVEAEIANIRAEHRRELDARQEIYNNAKEVREAESRGHKDGRREILQHLN